MSFIIKQEPASIDEYIATFPKETQAILNQIRKAVHEAAPQSKEIISYKMPAFEQNGILVWFAAFKNHIGFFPKATGIEAFQNQLTSYKTSKGTIQFPLNQPIPLDLIKKIVCFRIIENQKKP